MFLFSKNTIFKGNIYIPINMSMECVVCTNQLKMISMSKQEKDSCSLYDSVWTSHEISSMPYEKMTYNNNKSWGLCSRVDLLCLISSELFPGRGISIHITSHLSYRVFFFFLVSSFILQPKFSDLTHSKLIFTNFDGIHTLLFLVKTTEKCSTFPDFIYEVKTFLNYIGWFILAVFLQTKASQ